MSNSRVPLYVQGTKAFCHSCHDLLFVFKMDVFRGVAIHAGQLYGDRGQAPFHQINMLLCKKCGAINVPSLIKFERPAW